MTQEPIAEFNDTISPLERQRSADDFANCLEIARVCSLGSPHLEITASTDLNFERGLQASEGFKGVTISSHSDSIEVRALIAALTTLDAGAVANLTQITIADLEALRNRIWEMSERRGDYAALLASAPATISGLVGVLIGAAQRNLCTIIEGNDAFAAALLAQRLAYRSVERTLSAQIPNDPAAMEAQRRLRLPIVLATAVPRNASLVALKHLETTLSLTD